jgi:putative FmdB family regulatory protein
VVPTYGYHCDSCGAEFELWQRMTDEAVAECPKCGKAARRIFYPAGIVFKGSGFYKTDSRGSSSSSSLPAKTDSKTGTPSGSETKPAGGAEPPKPAQDAPAKPAKTD